MPIGCSNTLSVKGPEASLIKFRDENKTDKEPLSFEKSVPMEGPEENWYDEHCDKWGTKWDANDVSFSDGSDTGALNYAFDTALDPPIAWFEKVVALYPDLEFEMAYEGGWCDLYGASKGSGGTSTDTKLEYKEYFEKVRDDYKEKVADIKAMSQEKLIEEYSGVEDFSDKSDYYILAETVIKAIHTKNLPLFINVGWGGDFYNDLFKKRLSEGV